MAEMCTEEQVELVIARKITPQLINITTKLEVFTSQMSRLSELLSSDREDIKRVEATLFGNGKEGLTLKVQRNHEWILNQIWFQRLVITALVGNVIGTFIVLVKTFISP